MYRKANVEQSSGHYDKYVSELDSNSMKSLLETNVFTAIKLIEQLDPSDASIALTEIVVNIENIQNINQIHWFVVSISLSLSIKLLYFEILLFSSN